MDMKATGIVRRIDDLGRVVIPKEIRRTMRIREGDPLEIYTNSEGGVIFKKYSLMGGLGDFAGQMCETLNKTTGRISVITDRDTCLAVAGGGTGFDRQADLFRAGADHGGPGYLPVSERQRRPLRSLRTITAISWPVPPPFSQRETYWAVWSLPGMRKSS